MLLHSDRYSTTSNLIKNGCVIHDSEGSEGTLPWGQMASAQLIGFLQAKGDRPSPSRPGMFYGAGYHAVAREDGNYTVVATANAAPYHAPPCNSTMWAICIPGRASQSRDQWLDPVSRQYIRAVARYLIDRHHDDGEVWPLTFASASQLTARQAQFSHHPVGYTSHAQVSNAWHQTDHSDPGVSFPWDVLAADIRVLTEENPMKLYKKAGKDAVWLADKITRQHVPDVTSMSILIGKYGALNDLEPKYDLEQLGQQVLSYTGDV